ncbi:MAG: hypothetical protein ACOC97_01820 [Myxococcota bacterium]
MACICSRSGLVLVAGLLATVGWGCADIEPPPDSGEPRVDGEPRVEVTFEPDRPSYLPMARVTPVATVYDGAEEVVTDAAVTWSVSPQDAASALEDGVWRIGGMDGEVTFTACTTLDGDELCGSGTLVVDASPPVIELTKPEPGEELLEDESPTIEVAGTVTDTDGDADLTAFVNGAFVSLGADGSFSTEVPAEMGINHIEVEAIDRNGGGAVEALDVLWAPAYLPPVEGTTRFDLPEALLLRLGQRFMDTNLSGSDLDLSSDPVVASDLASVVELVLWHADLTALLGEGPVLDSGGIVLEVTSVEIGDVIVDVSLVEGGLELSIELYGVTIGTDGTATLDLGGEEPQELSLTGAITANLYADASLTIDQTGDGAVQVEVGGIDASLGPIEADMEDPDVDALVEAASGALADPVNDLIETELIPTFTDVLPSLFEDLLLEVEALLSDLTFELDTGLGDPVTVWLDGDIVDIRTAQGATAGHLTAVMDVSVEAQGTPVHPDSRGAAQADAMPEPPFTAHDPLQLAIRQDVINGLLHALWNAGLLELDTELSGVEAQVSAKLPPVVVEAPVGLDCGGAPCDVLLQIGQLEVSAVGQKFGIHAEAGARISMADGEVSLLIQMTPEVVAWEIASGDGVSVLTPAIVRGLVTDTVWPMLFDSLGSELSFPLPLPSLSELGLGEFAPALDAATLDLVMSRPLDVGSGYLGLAVALEVEAPAP